MSGLTDREVAAAAAEAAAAVALARRGDAGLVVAKDAPTDVASEVDRAAEAAAVAVIAAARPDDGYLGEEGAERAAGARTWVIDALDGTLNYLHGLNGWCAAVALEDEHGALAAAVCDPVRRELFTAARGEGAACNGRPLRLADVDGAATRTLDHALIATFLHQPKRDLRGVAATLHRVFAAAGSVRITGSGTLELACVAAGRLDGWIQPATFRWDWVPGALLVTEAGGLATRTEADPVWCIAAATQDLHAALEQLTR